MVLPFFAVSITEFGLFYGVLSQNRSFLTPEITKFGVFHGVLSQNSESRRQKNSGKAVLLHGSAEVGYPFLLSFSSVFGRLISLQNETTKAQLLARLKDIYGARDAVERALYYALGSFINWGLIKRAPESNILRAPEKIPVSNDSIGILIWKSMLHATQGNRLSVGALRNSPALYAFDMPEIHPAQRMEDTPDLCYQRNAGEDILTIHQSMR